MGASASVIMREVDSDTSADLKTRLRETAQSKFTELDADNSGFLETAELMAVAEWVITAFADEHVALDRVKERLMARIDSDGDGRLDFEEFFKLFLMMNARYDILKIATEKFTELDVDSNGALNGREIDLCVDWAMQAYETGEPEYFIFYRKAMMNKIDVNHDGRINLLEFIHLFEDMIARIELTNNARLKFAEFDVDKSGFLEASEIDRLVDVVLTTYVEKSPTERKKFHKTLLSRVDKNKDKKLDFGEFLKVWEMVMIRQDMIECARGKFRTLDKDGSGFLEKDELKPVLLEWISSSKDNTDVDLDTATRDLVEAIDANKDGKLDLLEFMVIFETTMANEGFWGIREPSM